MLPTIPFIFNPQIELQLWHMSYEVFMALQRHATIKKVTADVWSHIDEEKASDGFEILWQWQLKW